VRANNAYLNGKDNQQQLPHLWQPPDKSGSPAGWDDHGAPENDRLGGTIEEENTPSAAQPQGNISEHICGNCEEAFQLRKRSRGSARKFCSAQYRKAIHAGQNIVPNIGNIGDGECGGPSAPSTHVDDKVDHTDLTDIVVR
jgi:hypothetical protein